MFENITIRDSNTLARVTDLKTTQPTVKITPIQSTTRGGGTGVLGHFIKS